MNSQISLFFAKVNYTEQNNEYKESEDHYTKTIRRRSSPYFFLLCEKMADISRTGARWLAADLFQIDREVGTNKRSQTKSAHDKILKVIRVAIGIFTAIPGELIGSLLMAIAYIDPTIVTERQNMKNGTFEKTKTIKIEFKPLTAIFTKNASWGTLEMSSKSSFNPHDLQTKRFVICKQTKEIFNNDPSIIIRLKGILLTTVGTPLITAVRTLYHSTLLLANILFLLPIDVLEGRLTIVDGCKETLKLISNIFRTVIYGLRLTLAALYTIILPYQGRASYGALERQYHGHNRMQGPSFYLAPCFQMLGTYNTEEAEEAGKVSAGKVSVGAITQEWLDNSPSWRL